MDLRKKKFIQTKRFIFRGPVEEGESKIQGVFNVKTSVVLEVPFTHGLLVCKCNVVLHFMAV